MLAWGGRPTEGENKWSWGLIPTKASDLTDVWLWWMVAARVGREMAPRGVLLPCQMASPRKRSQRYQMPFVFNIFQPNLPCDKQNIKHNTCKEVIKFISVGTLTRNTFYDFTLNTKQCFTLKTFPKLPTAFHNCVFTPMPSTPVSPIGERTQRFWPLAPDRPICQYSAGQSPLFVIFFWHHFQFFSHFRGKCESGIEQHQLLEEKKMWRRFASSYFVLLEEKITGMCFFSPLK